MEHITRYGDAIGAEPGDVTVVWLPLYHDMGLITGFLLPMVLGGVVVVLGRVDDLLTVNGRSLFAHEVEDLLTALPDLAPGRALACTEFNAQLGAARLLILAEPARADSDIAVLEARIRRIVLAHTGLAPSAVHLLPRGFLVKSSSGKLARAESRRKFAQSRAGGPA